MKKIKLFIKDVLYVSKVTNTSKKKILIFIAVLLSQFSAIADISIILFFSYVITENISSNTMLYPYFITIFSKPILLPLIIIFRYSFNYMQLMIIKKLELNVQRNLKVHLLSEIFEKRNYSIADAYFYINTLTTHMSFFYASFTSFLNHLLQATAFIIYLIFTDLNLVSMLGIGVLSLIFPIYFLIKQARKFMHDSYIYGQDSNEEIQRVVENMFLIKLLKKEKNEISRFSDTLFKFNKSLFNNYKFGTINSYLPSFLTLFLLSLATFFTNISTIITLDIIGISLRLFQSLGNLSNSINQVINSHVHLEKFYDLESNKAQLNKNNFKLTGVINKKELVVFENVSFSYLNSNDFIFENISLKINRSKHTIITGKNGSGKSTLLGLIAGVYYPTKGLIENNSKKIGYVGATPLIFTGTLRENLLYGNDNKISDKIILEWLRKFQLFNNHNSQVLERIVSNKNLSTGQTQKIAYIRALLLDIDLLLLDESTANLDDYSRELIFKILKENKISIINSTHTPDSFPDADHHIKINVENLNRKIVQIY